MRTFSSVTLSDTHRNRARTVKEAKIPPFHLFSSRRRLDGGLFFCTSILSCGRLLLLLVSHSAVHYFLFFPHHFSSGFELFLTVCSHVQALHTNKQKKNSPTHTNTHLPHAAGEEPPFFFFIHGDNELLFFQQMRTILLHCHCFIKSQ